MFTNETKLVEIYGKSWISRKDTFFMDKASFHVKSWTRFVHRYMGAV